MSVHRPYQGKSDAIVVDVGVLSKILAEAIGSLENDENEE
jgi:hypothetical protein